MTEGYSIIGSLPNRVASKPAGTLSGGTRFVGGATAEVGQAMLTSSRARYRGVGLMVVLKPGWPGSAGRHRTATAVVAGGRGSPPPARRRTGDRPSPAG